MNKRKLHHQLGPVRRIRFWHYLVIAIFFGVLSAVSLRQNNLNALELRNNVLSVDKANGDVDQALQELRSYVYSHMNTDLATESGVYPPVQLKYRYERLLEKEQKRVANANEDVYSDAQKYCERQNSTDFSGRNRVPCIQQYVSNNGGDPKVKEIPEDLYKFNFTSPTWSPDLAGWSLVLTGVFTVLAISKLALEAWVKSQHI